MSMLETDEKKEAVSSLEMVVDQATKIASDVYRWKWVIVILHSTVQAFMVLSLKGTNSYSTLSEASQKQRELERKGIKSKKVHWDKLASFSKLFERIKEDQHMQRLTISKTFVSSFEIDKSMWFLNESRNDFIHFTPMTFSLATRRLAAMALDCLNVVRFCGWECGNFFWDDEDEPELRLRAEVALAGATAIFSKLDEFEKISELERG